MNATERDQAGRKEHKVHIAQEHRHTLELASQHNNRATWKCYTSCPSAVFFSKIVVYIKIINCTTVQF